jgi:hypothetical protein
VPEEEKGPEDADDADDKSRVSWLDPGAVRIFRDAAGHVRAAVAGERSVLRPALFRAFPVTKPDSFVELREEGGDSVGMLRELSSLDGESRELAEGLLRERYLVPVIEEIVSIRGEHGLWTWDVVTDRGERRFSIRSPRDDIRTLPSPDGARRRFRVTDTEGNVYEIRDLQRLPAHSRHQFSRIA